MMPALQRLVNRFGFYTREQTAAVAARVARNAHASRRQYEAGEFSRLTLDWPGYTVAQNALIGSQLRTMRARSQNLFRNEPYCRKFIRVLEKNVIGSAGILVSDRVVKGVGPDGAPELDRAAGAVVDLAWARWTKPPLCSTSRRESWPAIQRSMLRAAVMDGESFLVADEDLLHPFNFSVRQIPGTWLDEQLNANLPGGASIRMGIELDPEGRRVAYHFWKRDPDDYLAAPVRGGGERIRIPAARVWHYFQQDFPNQLRGVPWLFSAMTRLSMLGGYEEAELVAARVSASKQGFIIPPEGTPYPGDGTDEAGNTVTNVAAGEFEVLPGGSKLEQFNPDHPNAQFAPFLKAMLRGISAAGDVSYHTLSGDLESVNYSSARIGLLDERDGYCLVQSDFIDQVCAPVFAAWLAHGLVAKAIPLPLADFERLNMPAWRPRRWPWVDPQKEVTAAAQAVALRVKSRTAIIQQEGAVPDEVWAELCREEELLRACGLTPEPTAPAAPVGAAPPARPAEGDKDDDQDDDKEGEAGQAGRGIPWNPNGPATNGRAPRQSFHVPG